VLDIELDEFVLEIDDDLDEIDDGFEEELNGENTPEDDDEDELSEFPDDPPPDGDTEQLTNITMTQKSAIIPDFIINIPLNIKRTQIF
jgi:hypothetical protein